MIKKFCICGLIILLTGCGLKNQEVVRYRILKGSYLQRDDVDPDAKYIVIRERLVPVKDEEKSKLKDKISHTPVNEQQTNRQLLTDTQPSINKVNNTVSNKHDGPVTQPQAANADFKGWVPLTVEKSTHHHRLSQLQLKHRRKWIQ